MNKLSTLKVSSHRNRSAFLLTIALDVSMDSGIDSSVWRGAVNGVYVVDRVV